MPNFEDYHVTDHVTNHVTNNVTDNVINHVTKVRSPLSISKTIESDLVTHIHPPKLIIVRPKSTNPTHYAEIVA
jgi:hypothetical protein